VEILFVRDEQKDCNKKPDPFGERPKTTENRSKRQHLIKKQLNKVIQLDFALGIEVKILFERNEQKDCNAKPDPFSGERPKN